MSSTRNVALTSGIQGAEPVPRANGSEQPWLGLNVWAKAMTEGDDIFVSEDRGLLDIDFVCAVLHGSYWAKNRSREVIEDSIKNSLCFGLYERKSKKQLGFARVVTDGVTFSWLCDVIVDESHRKKGLGKLLLSCVVAHPAVKGTMCLLGTLDAHSLYEKFGFQRSEQMKRAPNKEAPNHPPQPA